MASISYVTPAVFEFPTGYKRCKLQKIVMDFHNDPATVAKIEIPPDEYTSLKSAGGSFRVAIKRIKLNILVRSIKGSIYLIKY